MGKNIGRGNKAVDIPAEWGDAAKKEDIVHVHEKLEKCYSQERYKDFQEAVEAILDRYLKGKVGWAAALWIVSVVGSMLAEKFLHIF